MKSVHTRRISVGILFVFMLVFSTRAFAIQEKFYSSLSGSQISNGASFQVWDDKFFQMMQGTSWMNDFANYNVTNRIALELDPTFTSLYNTSFTATCSLTVTHYNSTGQVTTVNPVVLTVSYDFNTGAVIQDKNVYEFTKGHFVTVT